MKNGMTRRGFLQRAAAGVAGPLVLPRLSLGASADGRLRHAAIGVANMGKGDLFAIAGSGRVDIVALCDIDENHLNAAAQQLPNARLYRDWRELLDKEKDNIDSVNVSTPDHMHAPIALSAIELGKHVYCQKPLAHEVFEARRLTEAARKAGVVTQMGIQIHSYDVYRRAVMMLRSGVIGKVKEWHSWCSASYSTPGMDRPAGEDPVPPTVNWDSWIGVAPMRPYKEGVYHPRSWRTWRDFGCGSMGDFGCHIFDPVFTALKLGAPRTVRAEAPEFTAEVWPQWSIVHYEFPGTHWTAGDTIQGTWYDGGKQPPHELAPPLPEGKTWPEMGSLLLGEEGAMLLPHFDEAILLPDEKFKDHPRPTVSPKTHYNEWVNACLGEEHADANFDYSGPLTEAILLGNVAVRVKEKTLEWDAPGMRFPNATEADALLRRGYREGWHIEGLG